ncbi:MAG: hypothetical protein FK734_13940 [Asgard group archaeon]|nr:hypothetical protein [Asgard group archaeon]
MLSEQKSQKEKIKHITCEDSDDLQNFTQEKPSCPHCGSTDVFGMSRVVGYFSIIENWNKSKKAELKNRQKGNYWHSEENE